MARLLYLCVHPRNRSPSQRYRFEQFEPYLRQHGIDVEYSSALSETDVPIFYGNTSAFAKGGVALRALARRAQSVLPRRASKFDAVLVQREAFFLFSAWSEWLAHVQAPLVFDFDDAIWIHAVSEANKRFKFLKNVDKVKRTVAMAKVVVAGNDYLANWSRQYNQSVTVIPTCVDTDRYGPRERSESGVVTIGWCGSPSTVPHFQLVLPVLERVKAKYADQVRIRVMGDPTFRHEPLKISGERWSSEAEVQFLQDMDIGLMPLPDTEWSKGKCGLKGLTSMACGAATILSPVGVNPSIVRHGINGMLADTDQEWFEAICRLVEDHGERRRLGDAGRQSVVDNYSVARWRSPFLSTILGAMR